MIVTESTPNGCNHINLYFHSDADSKKKDHERSYGSVGLCSIKDRSICVSGPPPSELQPVTFHCIG